MAALESSDVTVVVTSKVIQGKRRVVRGTLTIAGTDTYPEDGIPLPAIGKFGFVRQMDQLLITGATEQADQYVYGYDKDGHLLQLFESAELDGDATAAAPLAEATTSAVPGARTLTFEAVGW